jgi:mRNA interferase MazF
MKQREIWLANLNPEEGNEQKGIRPVVVISGNAMNDHLHIAIICPLTTRIKSYAGCLILKKDQVNGLTHDSEVLTFQVRTLASERFMNRLGEITESQLKTIKQGLNDILTY